jgi:hypothetical protein
MLQQGVDSLHAWETVYLKRWLADIAARALALHA